MRPIKRIYIVGNEYFRAMRPYYFHKNPFKDYFLEWNKWMIKGRDLEERKIFNSGDLHYITQNKWQY